MIAEICRIVAFAGLIVFFNCLVFALACCLLSCMGEDLCWGAKFSDLMDKCVALVVVIGVLSLITAMNGGLLYLALK